MTSPSFNGPLFIVGLPRSGTKLLRDLLNRHPRISIPTVETHFIPAMIRRFGERPPFDQAAELDRFYQTFTQTTFFENMRQQGRVLPLEKLHALPDRTSWPAILALILQAYAPPGKAEGFIWGDKTPGYLQYMGLLKTLFPQARFIHIIRDPRDYCLSVRQTWGKSLYRAATAWRESITAARRWGDQWPGVYLELTYETLLADPVAALQTVCRFLECDFVRAMTELEKPAENLGDARGHTSIVRENRDKYLTQLSAGQIRRIEEITYPLAGPLGYPLRYARIYRPLPSWTLPLLALYDAGASLTFHVREKGLRPGVRYFYRLHRESHETAQDFGYHQQLP